MTDFIETRTFCGFCNLQVKPGQMHICEFTDFFKVSEIGIYLCAFTDVFKVSEIGIYLCAWCQTYARPIPDHHKTTCSNCGHGLHGGTATAVHTAMHASKYAPRTFDSKPSYTQSSNYTSQSSC